ncbi:MAG: hypothetical protein MK180_07795 [Rhodobacteraceae bacterium]|nr:hypothetical protein [Paracoccaceae bacterium]
MRQIWIVLLLVGVVANLGVGWLAYQNGDMGSVSLSIGLAAMCAGVAYLRVKQAEKK